MWGFQFSPKIQRVFHISWILNFLLCSLTASVGGGVGLGLGFSFITAFEFVFFIYDYIKLSSRRAMSSRKQKQPSKSNVIEVVKVNMNAIEE